MRAQLTYSQERWATFWPEAQLLLAAHHQELDPEGPFEVNLAMAEGLDAAGALVILTARVGPAANLVGYCLWYLGPALDSPVSCATQGPWFVMPEWRASGAGIKLFTRSLEALRAAGVERALPHHWMDGGGPRLGKFFARLGAKPIEVSYSLWLNGAP